MSSSRNTCAAFGLAVLLLVSGLQVEANRFIGIPAMGGIPAAPKGGIPMAPKVGIPALGGIPAPAKGNPYNYIGYPAMGGDGSWCPPGGCGHEPANPPAPYHRPCKPQDRCRGK